MSNSSTPEGGFKVAALYRFCRLSDPAALRAPLTSFCAERGIRGTLLLAREGINGTVAGPDGAIDGLLAWLDGEAGIHDAQVKFGRTAEMPFHRLKIRLKREIVTLGIDGVDPLEDVGTYVEPRDWNRLIDDPGTVVLDTRNGYETAIGSFTGAIDPHTASFREFPAWVERNRAALEGRRIAMFCTGGIRCEKATSYMRSLGFGEVYHLRGGILRYLEEVPAGESRWQGECFVFDERVSVVHGLGEGEAELCRACRHPVTPSEKASPLFVEGVSCPHCRDSRTDEDRARYAERHRQVSLARERGEAPHIGNRHDPDQGAPSRRR